MGRQGPAFTSTHTTAEIGATGMILATGGAAGAGGALDSGTTQDLVSGLGGLAVASGGLGGNGGGPTLRQLDWVIRTAQQIWCDALIGKRPNRVSAEID